MGRFVNPGNSAFKVALASEIYIDKTNLLDFTNSVLGTKQAYICNSRPRRFGKSITADMLTAYYSKGCDSRELFMNYNIAQTEDFEKYLNKYDVIHLDMQWILMDAGAPERISGYINKNVISELADLYKDIDLRNQKKSWRCTGDPELSGSVYSGRSKRAWICNSRRSSPSCRNVYAGCF